MVDSTAEGWVFNSGYSNVKADTAAGSRIESLFSGKTRDELLARLVDLTSEFPEIPWRIWKGAADSLIGQVKPKA